MATHVEWKIIGMDFPSKIDWMATATNDAGAMRSITGTVDISKQAEGQTVEGLTEIAAMGWVFDALGEQVPAYEKSLSDEVEGQPAINADTYKKSKLPWEK